MKDGQTPFRRPEARGTRPAVENIRHPVPSVISTAFKGFQINSKQFKGKKWPLTSPAAIPIPMKPTTNRARQKSTDCWPQREPATCNPVSAVPICHGLTHFCHVCGTGRLQKFLGNAACHGCHGSNPLYPPKPRRSLGEGGSGPFPQPTICNRHKFAICNPPTS